MSGRDLVSGMRESGSVPATPRPRGHLLDLALLVIAALAVGSAGFLGLGHFLSPGSQPPLAPGPALMTGVAEPQMTAVLWTDADSARCKAKARAATDAPLPAEMGLANRAVTEGFAGLATGLDCYLSSKIERFCDPQQKAAMVAAVNDYLGRVDLLELGMGVEGAPMALIGGMTGGEIAVGSDVYDEQKSETLDFMAIYHKRLATDMQTLARNGIVAASDFGGAFGGIPKRIAAMFGTVAAQRNLCA